MIPLYQQILLALLLIALLVVSGNWFKRFRKNRRKRESLVNTYRRILSDFLVESYTARQMSAFLQKTEIFFKIPEWLTSLASISTNFPDTTKACDLIAQKWINLYLDICFAEGFSHERDRSKIANHLFEPYKNSGTKLFKPFWIDSRSLRIISIGSLVYSIMDMYRVLNSNYTQKSKMRFDSKVLPELCLEIAEIAPKNGGNNHNRANLFSEIHYALSSLNRFDEASKYISKAIYLFTENPKFYTNRAVLNDKKIIEYGDKLSEKETNKLKRLIKEDIIMALIYGPYPSALALAKQKEMSEYSIRKHKIGVIIRVLQKYFEGSLIEQFYKATVSHIIFESFLIIGLLFFAIFDFITSWTQQYFSSTALLIIGIVGGLFWIFSKRAAKSNIPDYANDIPPSYGDLKRSIRFSMLESLSLSFFTLSFCFLGLRIGRLFSLGQLFSLADILFNSVIVLGTALIFMFHFKKVFTYKW